MNGWIRRSIVLAASLSLLTSLAAPALASCGSATLLGTNSGAGKSYVWTRDWFVPDYGYPPYVFSPTGPPVGPEFDGVWWGLGTGDPTAGPGDDSGTVPVEAWFYYNPTYYGTGFYAGEIFGGWGLTPEIDGCILNNPTGCTCILLTDQYAGQGYFALLAAQRGPGGTTFFDQPGSDGAGNAGPIVLSPIPGPWITWAARVPGTYNVALTMHIPLPIEGLYQKEPCDCAAGLSYKIVGQELPRWDPAPLSRDREQWTEMLQPGGLPQAWTPVGQSVTVETDACTGGGDLQAYLAVLLRFDPDSGGGFISPVVSHNSSRIECGPTLADPEPLRPRTRPDAPRVPRPSRSGPER